MRTSRILIALSFGLAAERGVVVCRRASGRVYGRDAASL
jgi:hypothetical protein